MPPDAGAACARATSRGRGGRLSTALAVALFLTAGPACGQEAASFRGPGHYVTGFETSEFVPCAPEHANERWWLAGDSAVYPALQDAAYGAVPADERKGRTGRAFVRLRGRITPPGRYGHMGAYEREIEVAEVLDARPDPAGTAACP